MAAFESLTAAVAVTVGTLVLARLFGYVYNRGVMSGRLYENNLLCKYMKGHPADNGEWHELLGQFHDGIDVVIINTEKAREIGISTYLYTALHEGYHAFHHKGKANRTQEDTARMENEANDFAVAALPTILGALALKGLIDTKDAGMPDIFSIDGIPEVVYGDALKQLRGLMAEVRSRDPNAKVVLKRRPENDKSASGENEE